jgi:hypothetical protein
MKTSRVGRNLSRVRHLRFCILGLGFTLSSCRIILTTDSGWLMIGYCHIGNTSRIVLDCTQHCGKLAFDGSSESSFSSRWAGFDLVREGTDSLNVRFPFDCGCSADFPAGGFYFSNSLRWLMHSASRCSSISKSPKARFAASRSETPRFIKYRNSFS